MEYDFIEANGFEIENENYDEIFFDINLIINCKEMYEDLSYFDTIINNIYLEKRDDNVYFEVNMSSSDGKDKISNGKISKEQKDSYRVVTIYKELIDDEEVEETVTSDFFTIGDNFIRRYTYDKDYNEFYSDVKLFSEDQLTHLFTLYTEYNIYKAEYEMYKNFLKEVINEKDVVLSLEKTVYYKNQELLS